MQAAAHEMRSKPSRAVGGVDAMQPVHARLRRFAYAERARMSFVVRKSRQTS
jgi:hypothetical protein